MKLEKNVDLSKYSTFKIGGKASFFVEVNPNDTQSRTSLAAVYLAAGLRAEAVIELRKAIENDPAFKEQGEFFIQEIEAGRNP